jgi:hypothetical protein
VRVALSTGGEVWSVHRIKFAVIALVLAVPAVLASVPAAQANATHTDVHDPIRKAALL